MKYNETCAHYQATTPGRGGDPALPPLSPSSLMHSQLCQTCPPFCNFSHLQKKLRNRHGQCTYLVSISNTHFIGIYFRFFVGALQIILSWKYLPLPLSIIRAEVEKLGPPGRVWLSQWLSSEQSCVCRIVWRCSKCDKVYRIVQHM